MGLLPTFYSVIILFLLLGITRTATSSSSSFSTDSAIQSGSAATFPLQTRPFLTEPDEEAYLAREGERGPALNCSVAEQYRDRKRFELEWTKIVGDTPILVSRNGRLFVPSGVDGYELADTVSQDGGYHLRLRGVQFARDNGRFFCALIDTETRQQMLSEPARVVVLVPPQTPQITAQPAEPVREGEFVSMRCESQGGNPAPHFHWLFDNRTRVPESWYHERHEGGPRGRTVSTLQWHLGRTDNGAYLTCQTWNRALREGEPMSAETNRLNVLYAPRVRVVPAVPELNVEEGELVPLLCTADANPPAVAFQWTHSPSGEVHAEREWRLQVRRAHSGEFRCSATNSLDSGSDRLRLNVLYGPTVRIKTANGGSGTVSPVEGERMVLDCEADANPKADALSWTGPGGFQRNGSRLVIESVNRAHSGNFTCAAWNTLSLTSSAHSQSAAGTSVIRTGFARVHIDVRRRPGPALIIAKRTSTLVGESIVLGCSTDGDAGSPPARFRWAGPATKGLYGKEPEWNRAQLKLTEAQLAHNGLYRCAAYNEIGQGEEASIRVTVVEPARISRPPMPSKTLSLGASDISIECEARGFPQPRIHWLKDRVPLPLDGPGHWTFSERPTSAFSPCPPEESCVHAVLSTLRFVHPTSWADKGNYTCVAQNSPIAPSASSSTTISVIHEPIILNERSPEGVALAAADLGATARMVCRVSARPEPKVSWSRDGAEVAGENGYRISMARVGDAIDEFEAVLELEQVGERDYGVFTCEARNGVGGKGALEIRLQARSPPQSPLQPRLLQSGLTWLLVGWRAGFDGGDQQLFELEYRAVDAHSGKVASDTNPLNFVFGPHNWTEMTFYGLDDDRNAFSGRPDSFLVHNLTHLRPLNTFWFRVRARNIRGMSDWTPIASGDTVDPRESMDIQAPESALYQVDERKLVVQPLKYSASHCLLVYVASEEDGQWRSLDCFPLSESDGIVPGIAPAERFKVRYCMANDVAKCSTGLKIFVEHLSPVHSAWMIGFIFCSVCFLSLSILIALLCFRRRFHQKINAAVRRRTAATANGVMKPAKKRLNLDGGVMVDRIDMDSPLAHGNNAKNTPVTGSQTDSGVFTLGSSSAVAAAAIAANGKMAHNDSGDWRHSLSRAHGLTLNHPSLSPSHQQPSAAEPFDFSDDPFLQEFAAANALGGIVVVENTLHQSSSTESSPSMQLQQQRKPPNPYSKFFNDFSSSLIGNGTTSTKRTSPVASGAGRHPSVIIAGGEGGGGGGTETGNSNEQLITSSGGGDSSGSSSSSGEYGGAGGGGRVMREIIV